MSAFRLLASAPSVVLSATITASDTQATLAARQTTITPSGGTGYTYAGSLSKPTGSSAALDSATTANPTFTPDKAGLYAVTLTATDTASGATVTKVSTLEVRTASALSVSIAAISDSASLPTSGTQALDSTVSNAIGSVTYAWSGEDPAGNAVSFSDATAADPTITYTSTQLPGLWSVTVVVTDSARSESVSATVRWTTGGLLTATTPRAIYMAVTGGVLLWKEQILVGSHWVDVGTYAALTTETDGGVTFSGTGLTLPSGLAVNTAAQSNGDERYVAISSASSALQALVAAGARWELDFGAATIENVDYARWGLAVTSAAGSFDTAGENLVSARLGWDVTAGVYRLQLASTASYNNADTSASLGTMRLSAQIGTTNTGSIYWPAGAYDSSFSPGTTTPTRIYWIAGAQTSPSAATVAVGAPWARFAVYPVVS